MKITKQPNLIAICAAVVIFNFSSCKYEDGPSISLRTKAGRLSGEWEATKVAGEKLSSDESLILEFDKNGDMSYNLEYSYYGSTSSYTIDGEWEWEDSKKSLDVTLETGYSDYNTEWEITRLTNKELEFEDEDGDKWELEKI